MLGPETDTAGREAEGSEDSRLAEECRAMHQRLLSIAHALGALGEEIDRALVEGRTPRQLANEGGLGDPGEDQETRPAG